MRTIFTQNDNFNHFKWNKCNFVHFLRYISACNKKIFYSQFEISHVLNGTTPKIQNRKWGPQCLAIEKKNCLAFYLTVAYGEQQQNAWNAVTELSVETKKLYLFDQEWARGLNSDDISTVEIAISAIRCIPNKWVSCLLNLHWYTVVIWGHSMNIVFFLRLWG